MKKNRGILILLILAVCVVGWIGLKINTAKHSIQNYNNANNKEFEQKIN